MDENSFKEHYQELLRSFELWLNCELENSHVEPLLWEPCRYMLQSSGKRVRPVLTLAVGDLLGVGRELLRPFCLAVEYLHTASLIHDDLPALDNDDMRRGRPTCHRAFDEAKALLAGDLLITHAFELLAEGPVDLPPAAVKALVRLLGRMSVALCEGQVLDLAAVRPATGSESAAVLEPDAIESIYRKKTGALFESCFLAPLSFLPDARQAATADPLRSLAVAFGLLFQLTDDLLDAPPGQTPQGGELSYTARFGRAQTEQRADQLVHTIGNQLRVLDAVANEHARDFLHALASYVRHRNN